MGAATMIAEGSPIAVDDDGVDLTIRRALEDDQLAITGMVRRARLNPAHHDWDRFVIAVLDRRTVGAGQLRLHSDNSLELASLVVEPDARGLGIASRIVEALLADERCQVHTLIDRRYVDHFARWGFVRVDPSLLPRSVHRTYRIGRVVTAVGSLLRRRRIRLVPLVRAAR